MGRGRLRQLACAVQMSTALAATALAGTALVVTVLAVAGDAQAARRHKKGLEQGEELYLAGRYQEAAAVLERVAADPKAGADRVVRALRYAAFSYFLLGDKETARKTWLRVLELRPGTQLDPVEASPEFVEFFNSIVQEPLAPSGSPSDAAAAGAEIHGVTPSEASSPGGEPGSAGGSASAGSASEGEAEGGSASKTASETGGASTSEAATGRASERGVPPAPREAERGCGIVLCLIPGGVGQYANGQIVKGLVFTTLELGFLALNIFFWAANDADQLRGPDGRYYPRDLELAQQRYAMQMTFFGLTVGTAALGIIDAFLLY